MLFLGLIGVGHAAGFYTTTSGTRALSQGGAIVASVDDITAQFHNPAGLVRLEGPQVTLNSTAVETTGTFQRAGFQSVSELGKPFVIPTVGFATRFGLENTVFALGFYPPYAPDLQFPDGGAQRYSLVDSLEWQAYAGPTVAHRFGDWLSVGLGLQWTFLRAEQEFYITTCNDPKCANDSASDIRSTLEALDPAKFMVNAGVLIQPTDQLSIGLFVEPPIHYEANGSLTTEIPEENPFHSFVEGDAFKDDAVTILVDFPLIAKLGVSFEPNEDLLLEVDAGYQGWSVNQEIRLTDLDMTIPLSEQGQAILGVDETSVTDDVVIKTGEVDSFSVHVGGNLDVSQKVKVRLGTFYETTATPPESLSVAFIDGNKIGVGAGASWRASEALSFDFGLSETFFLIPDVTTSEQYQVVLDLVSNPPAIVEGEAVGNGAYDLNTTLASIGATYHF